MIVILIVAVKWHHQAERRIRGYLIETYKIVSGIVEYGQQWRNVGYGRPPAGAPVAHLAPPVAP